MARKKIVSEEEVSKPAMAEETTEANADDAAPADLMPGSNAEESITSEATPTETSLEGINGNDAEGSVQTEKPESVSAEKASEEAMPVEDASVSEEELPAESERADASIEEVTTEPESASDALSEAAILHDAGEDGNSVSDMVPREISELHDEAEEAAEYSVDLSEEPETVSPESTPISSTEESDWGFQEPKKEITEEKGLEPPLEAPVPAGRSKIAPKSDRQLFYELKFNNLDRGLPPEERQEWNSIYASYRGRSAITGTIIGVDPHSIYVWNPETERREKKTMYCAIVVPYRVRIVIPASEMWESGNERPDYVLQNMVGASIDLVIIKVEREAGFAIDKCESVFFLNSENSISIAEEISKERTASPWIYNELSLADMIKIRPINCYRDEFLQFSHRAYDAVNESSSLQIKYEVDKILRSFISLSKYDLISCAKEWRANNKSFQSALDYIYLSKDIIIKQDVLIS